jgi:hypothetical protein
MAGEFWVPQHRFSLSRLRGTVGEGTLAAHTARGLDRSDRQVFEREAGVKDDFVAAAR